MNQENEVPTYGLKGGREEQTTDGTAAKEQSSQKQEAGDSNPENDDDSNLTVVAARPVASGGFSTSSVSEEFVKELKQIRKSFEQSSAEAKMLEDDLKDNGADKAAERAAGKALVDGHRVSKSRSSSRNRRHHRHRSASSAVDRRETRRDECPVVQKRPDGGPVTHRRQRHHHYRHQRRIRDGDFSDGGAQPASTAPQRHRRCCRSPAISDSCCFRASMKHASEGDHPRKMGADEDGEAENGTQQFHDERKSGKRSKARGENGATNQADGKCGDVFSRYRSNYRSADTDSTSSSSSSENERGEDAAAARQKREGSRTFTYTQTRESSTQLRSRRKIRSPCSRDRSHSSSQRHCVDGPVESTVEKHVLELNFPSSPLMRSISNLLKLHCPCQDSIENKGNVDDEDDGDEEEKNEASAEHFVHRMKPGQTCELQGDSQVILVSLPEPHKLTVEHVIRSSSSLVEQERCVSRHREKGERGCAERDRKMFHHDKNGARCEETVDAPRFRRKHSYVRHTRRLKGPNACQDDSAPPKAINRCSSSSSDSSEEDEHNDLYCSKEKGTEEVVVRPATKSSRHNRGGGREEYAGGGSSTQRELRLTIPRAASGETSRKRSLGLRKAKRSSKASSADSQTHGDHCGEGPGEEDSTLRIVFTDSRLNTELRCILQERSNPSREGRRESSRTAQSRRRSGGPCPRDTRRQQVDTRKASEDNTEADSARESAIRRQHCGCAPVTQRQRTRHGAEDPDVVSSSYYSSTHESSVALNEATKAGSRCTLCHTIRAMGAKERPWRRHWQRGKHAHR